MVQPAITELDLAERAGDYSVDVLITSTPVLEFNKHRTFATFVNDSDMTIYLRLGQASALNTGIRLNAAGGAFEINKTNLYKGEVFAIRAAGAGNKRLCVCEGMTRYPG